MPYPADVMTAHPPTVNGSARRVVLVDFDWIDADLVPQLLQLPGVSVRLVAGERSDDAGVRLAELCGLPRTVDLADLTREIFDLALVSERSPRRTQIEGLLLALGTPSASPHSFLSAGTNGDTTPAVEAPLELHAAVFETTLGGGSFDAIVEQALPDFSPEAPTEPQPMRPTGRAHVVVPSLDDFPSVEDRRGLEAAIRELMANTGAGRAEIHMGGPDSMELVVELGPQDPLLKGLVALAVQLGTPQVVETVMGQSPGKAWGAWPFRTTQRHGVIAAAAIDPASGWASWQKTVDELRTTWDQHDREIAGAAFPLLADTRAGWLGAEEFTVRVELSLERHRRDGLRFALHRLSFPGAPGAVDGLCMELPKQLRETDCIARPTPTTILLLTAGPRDGFTHARRRLMTLWERAWAENGNPPPAPAVTDERIEMLTPGDGELFMTTAAGWLSGA